MSIEDEILLNKFGQELVLVHQMNERFNKFNIIEKREYLQEVMYLILQSKPKDKDVDIAILNGKLKSTYTPCIMLQKGIAQHQLIKIINLPENELEKVLVLFLNVFKVSYSRRFYLEKYNPNKWWYWDLSDETNILKILKDKGNTSLLSVE